MFLFLFYIIWISSYPSHFHEWWVNGKDPNDLLRIEIWGIERPHHKFTPWILCHVFQNFPELYLQCGTVKVLLLGNTVVMKGVLGLQKCGHLYEFYIQLCTRTIVLYTQYINSMYNSMCVCIYSSNSSKIINFFIWYHSHPHNNVPTCCVGLPRRAETVTNSLIMPVGTVHEQVFTNFWLCSWCYMSYIYALKTNPLYM